MRTQMAHLAHDKLVSQHYIFPKDEKYTGEKSVSAEENALIARRWFIEGWAGNLKLADEIFAANLNGKRVGPVRPKRNIVNRLVGFPDIQSKVEEQFVFDDTVVTHVVWCGTYLGIYSGVFPTKKPVEIMTLIIWHFKEGKVVEDWTIIDHFSLFQQLGILSSTLRGGKFQLPLLKTASVRERAGCLGETHAQLPPTHATSTSAPRRVP